MAKLIECTILGSFKFKKYIDETRNELEQLGVKVLAPEKGTVFTPPIRRQIRLPESFRPLNSERGMPIRIVEDRFLSCIAHSDLVYLVNLDGYVGDVVSFEIGFAVARNIPIYAKERVDLKLDLDPDWRNLMKDIPNISVSDAIEDFKIKNQIED